MNDMRQGLAAWILVMGSGISALASIQVGDRIRFTDQEGSISAGEYGVHKLNSVSPAGGDAGSAELFRTFCIERSSYLDFDSKGFIVESIASFASPGGSESPNDGNPLGDMIEAQTAWLFYKFSTQTLSGYNFSPHSMLHTHSANMLQNALWWLEDEGGENNAFVSLANAAVASLDPIVQAEVAFAVAHVQVLNIRFATDRHGFDGVYEYSRGVWSGPGPSDEAQSVLYLTHAPEPAALVIWLALAGCGLAGAYSSAVARKVDAGASR